MGSCPGKKTLEKKLRRRTLKRDSKKMERAEPQRKVVAEKSRTLVPTRRHRSGEAREKGKKRPKKVRKSDMGVRRIKDVRAAEYLGGGGENVHRNLELKKHDLPREELLSGNVQ